MSLAQNRYSPLYFLASLGAGGLAVTFFMWLMFWVPHPNQPVPIFENNFAVLTTGSILQQAMVLGAMAGIAVFGFLNIKLLIWNLGRFSAFRAAASYSDFAASNAGSQVLALPLALAMTVNVGFLLGLTFVPGLWSIVEYLFPAAMAAFLMIGILAFRMIADFLKARFANGGFKCATNNSFAQVLPAFALSMIGVGLAAPAAMSNLQLTAGVSIILGTFFITAALLIAFVAAILGLRSIMENGLNVEAAPTLMVIIPLITVVSIAMMRISHGLHVHFDIHGGAGETFTFLTRMLSIEVLIALFGIMALASVGYLGRFINGTEASAGSYALVCPGVAMSVLGHFWINKGLVATGMIAKFGAAYWVLSALALGLQFGMIALVLILARKHFAKNSAAALAPAE
jgi:hypothetical protein